MLNGGGGGFLWFMCKRSHDVNKCAPRIEGVTPHNFAILEVDRALLPGFFMDVPVDSLFVVNSLENIQIVLSFIDDRLQSILITDKHSFYTCETKGGYYTQPACLSVCVQISVNLESLKFTLKSCYSFAAIVCRYTDHVLTSVCKSEPHSSVVRSPARPIFFPRIKYSHCDWIHSSLSAVRCFDNGYVGKQPVA